MGIRTQLMWGYFYCTYVRFYYNISKNVNIKEESLSEYNSVVLQTLRIRYALSEILQRLWHIVYKNLKSKKNH